MQALPNAQIQVSNNNCAYRRRSSSSAMLQSQLSSSSTSSCVFHVVCVAAGPLGAVLYKFELTLVTSALAAKVRTVVPIQDNKAAAGETMGADQLLNNAR